MAPALTLFALELKRFPTFLLNRLAVSIFLSIFVPDSGSPVGKAGQNFVVKGRLRTLSSTSESRKFKSRRNATERPRWVYYTLQTSMVSADKCNISRRGLTRVAYPGQGDARARMWDRREVEHPRLSRLLLTTQFWRPPNQGSYRQKELYL